MQVFGVADAFQIQGCFASTMEGVVLQAFRANERRRSPAYKTITVPLTKGTFESDRNRCDLAVTSGSQVHVHQAFQRQHVLLLLPPPRLAGC